MRARPLVCRFLIIAWSLAVSAAPSQSAAQTSPTAILDRVRVNSARPIDFHAIALPETVYVGQQATYQVAVLLSADARSKLRRNPEFLPPELRGLLAYELGTPTRVPPRSFDGAVYEAHVFQRALFPVVAGRQIVPAPQLTYSLPQSSSYFSREERYVVRAESASFVVKALPLDGRPDDFNGAVGVFRASVRVDTTAARVGDPLVLTLRVQGTGNVKLLPRPALEVDWASAVAGTERIVVDSSGALVRGTKEFDWILTPARDGRVDVPVLRYSYFDPYLGRYAIAESAPLALAVRRGTLAQVEESEQGTVLPLRPPANATRTVVRWSGKQLPPSSWWPWIALALLVPLPTIMLARRPRTSRAPSGAASSTPRAEPLRRESIDSGSRAVARAARRELLDSLAQRFAQSPQALVSRKAVARLLRRAGVSRATTRDMLAQLERLDQIGFASDAAAPDETSAEATARACAPLLARVDAEAVPRHRLASLGAIGLLLCVVASSGASPTRAAAQARADRSDVVQNASVARDAYNRRAYGEAVERYRERATALPRDPDAQADWGTAAWAAGDTVGAVVGWQRAARMEPLAVDVQERISLLPAGARGGIADVPMIPVDQLTAIAITAWVLGWIALAVIAWHARRERRLQPPRDIGRWLRWTRLVASLVVLVGAASAAAAWWGLRVLDPAGLSVVARPETMRVAPGNDADAMGGVTTGDIVRVIELRGAWQHVEHADGRIGWLPDARLVAVQPAQR